ncbi:hypothetical protein ACOSQ4_004060 [Xanthoceras sorbifolium]
MQPVILALNSLLPLLSSPISFSAASDQASALAARVVASTTLALQRYYLLLQACRQCPLLIKLAQQLRTTPNCSTHLIEQDFIVVLVHPLLPVKGQSDCLRSRRNKK